MNHNKSHNIEDQNWHIDKKALELYYKPADIQFFSKEDGLRIIPTFGKAEGYREIINLTKGFQVVLGDITCKEEAFITMKSDPTLKMHFRLEGSSGLELNYKEESEISHHTMSVMLQSANIDKQEHYLSGQHERSVTLICEPEFLKQHYSSLTDDLSEKLALYINDAKVNEYGQKLMMRTDMVTAANSILQTELDGILRKSYIFAKSIELVVLSLQSLMDSEANLDNPEKGLKQRDIERIHKAREILESNFIEPPTINELARKIGINEAKLMHTFKQVLGQTIFDYTQNLRMDKAKLLLETTDRSITEIAFDVGYDYSSNFTTAFKRRFGITPSLTRDAFRK
jgi:AraC-like DNA-binding protein